MAFAAAVSEHPVTAHAVGEVTGQVLEALGDEAPDLAVLFVTARHAHDLAEAGTVVRHLLRPRTLLGAAMASVLANGREVEETPAVTLWAGHVGPVVPVTVGPEGVRGDPPFEPTAMVVLSDPFSVPLDATLAAVDARWPGLPVVGGLASVARRPGDNRLLLDDRVSTAGAVGVLLGPGAGAEVVVSQGARPIGPSFTVTAAEGHDVHELGGRPAVACLLDLVGEALTEPDVRRIEHGAVHVGRPVGSDHLVLPMVRSDQRRGTITLSEPVRPGDSIRFHLADPDAAGDDLRATLNGRTAASALVFTATARGTQLFDGPHHDAALVAEYLGRPPVAGAFCGGQFGPVGGRNFVLPGGVSAVLFHGR